MRNMESNKTFRFDDVCINSDMELHYSITDYLLKRFPECKIIWAISPLVHKDDKESQRVFPKLWNAYSDNSIHYYLDSFGIPVVHEDRRVRIATHGLIHCDHRLLGKEAQELSILLSRSLVAGGAGFCYDEIEYFVPPFNKWNKDTEEICKENRIKLIKFEDSWLSCEHNEFDPEMDNWYLHAREWTMESIKKYFGE